MLSAELGEPVTFRVATERQFLEHLTGAGVPVSAASAGWTQNGGIVMAWCGQKAAGWPQDFRAKPGR